MEEDIHNDQEEEDDIRHQNEEKYDHDDSTEEGSEPGKHTIHLHVDRILSSNINLV